MGSRQWDRDEYVWLDGGDLGGESILMQGKKEGLGERERGRGEEK